MPANTITGRDPETGRTVSVQVESGRISRVETRDDPTDLFLSPGFVDLQVNGCSGFDMNAEHLTENTIIGLVEAMLAHGVTCFAPTIITAPEAKICQALRVIADARRNNPKVAACIPFVHVEGPHISPLDGYRGAHPPDSVRPPSMDEFERWQSAAAGLVGLVTLSPHFNESSAYCAALVKRGVRVAVGHTHATPEEIRRVVDAAARLSTHLGNGIASLLARHPNPIWTQLAEDRLTATFIADGHHLPADALKAMLRAKCLQRSVLVSDSAGTTEGGGTFGFGTVFKMSQDGSVVTLHDFAGGSDGEYPLAAPIQSVEGDFFGTTFGQNAVHGSVYSITKEGKFTLLHTFTGMDGSNPLGPLV